MLKIILKIKIKMKNKNINFINLKTSLFRKINQMGREYKLNLSILNTKHKI
jgi:hypothetical protein